MRCSNEGHRQTRPHFSRSQRRAFTYVPSLSHQQQFNPTNPHEERCSPRPRRTPPHFHLQPSEIRPGCHNNCANQNSEERSAYEAKLEPASYLLSPWRKAGPAAAPGGLQTMPPQASKDILRTRCQPSGSRLIRIPDPTDPHSRSLPLSERCHTRTASSALDGIQSVIPTQIRLLTPRHLLLLGSNRKSSAEGIANFGALRVSGI